VARLSSSSRATVVALLLSMGCNGGAPSDTERELETPLGTGVETPQSTVPQPTGAQPSGAQPSGVAAASAPSASTVPATASSSPEATSTSVAGTAPTAPMMPPVVAGSSAPSGAAAGGAASTGASGSHANPDPSGPVATTPPGEGTDGGAPGSGSGGSGTAGAGGQSGAGGSGGAQSLTRPMRVLLYSFSTLDIPSVPSQLSLLRQHLESWQYDVDESENPADFSDENLARYAAVGMINTCFSPFGANNDGAEESEALQRFLQAGGGLFGTHCADVTFQSVNPPALYNRVLGGRASSQNFEGTNQCRKMQEHPTTAALPDTFSYVGNLDGTDFIAEDSLVLVHCTWGDANGTDVAVSWVRNEGLGRVFFTNFAKVDTDLEDPVIGDAHVIAGLEWVLGR
jgi:type 1 glutamine amidotransferase